MEEHLGSHASELLDAAVGRAVHEALLAIPAERRAAGRKQGEQPGAPGTHLAQVADPDVIPPWMNSG